MVWLGWGGCHCLYPEEASLGTQMWHMAETWPGTEPHWLSILKEESVSRQAMADR